MSKYFRPWNIDQTLLLPPNVQDFVPKGHVSRFIVALVRESLDLKEITSSYVSRLGQPPFDPRMMVALLLHGYASGLYSSRRIAKACRERNDFVMIVALDPPDFRTISDFRKRHLKALGALFIRFSPQNAEIEDIKASIAKSLPKDFKNTKTVTSEVKEYFHSGETFTICLLTAKTCRAAGDIATVRRLLDETLRVMRNWLNADSQREVIRAFEQLKEKAKANNFKPQLMSTMVIATVLAAFCKIILAQERKIERVGWFPDRDKITTSYNRIAEHMLATNFSAFCQRHKVDEHPIVTLIGRAETDVANPKQSWYDQLVRTPDFLAAALANWHYNKNDKTTMVTARQKYVDMLQGAVADNPYVIPLLLVETESGICVGKLWCSKDPIAQECQQTVS